MIKVTTYKNTSSEMGIHDFAGIFMGEIEPTPKYNSLRGRITCFDMLINLNIDTYLYIRA